MSNMIHKLIINGIECTATVRTHDTSVSGLQYKLVVTFPVNMLPRRRSVMHQIYCSPPKRKSKPKYDLGTWANDVGNALGRELGFKYGWYPSIDKGHGRTTTFSFFFSDTAHAVELGFVESEHMIRARLRMEADGAASGLTVYGLTFPN